MDVVMKYWIEYHAPGAFVGESWTVDSDFRPSWEDIEWPDNAYAATLWQREDIVRGGKTYKGAAEHIGPRYYYHPDSRITTLKELERGDHGLNLGHALLSNMRCNKWGAVIWTRWGNWPQPYNAATMEILPG